jgi:hypothetical protein
MRNHKIPPALKHGVYSAMGLLPTEDPVAFDKLRRDCMTHFNPADAFEENIVADIARYMWRKQNLATLHVRALVGTRRNEIIRQHVPNSTLVLAAILPETYPLSRELPEGRFEILHRGVELAEEQVQKEFGAAYNLVDSKIGTTDHLVKELTLEQRLDEMIDKCLKRLLFVRGLKSISAASTLAPKRRRIAGPKSAKRPDEHTDNS